MSRSKQPLNDFAIDAALERVNRLLASHGGGVEVIDVSDRGDMTVRFVGMCSGCPCKPLTMAATVRPMLGQLSGITNIEAEGARISVEAARRLVALGIAPKPPESREPS
jgi:Fe-S cluster biogenesis protein NfuA